MDKNIDELNYFWQGEKVKLRPLRIDDWLTIYDEQADSEGIRSFDAGIQLPKTEEAVKEKLENNIKDQFRIGIENSDGDFVGTANIHSRDERNGTFSFAIRIFRSYRCKGYAKDAFRILLRYGFYELRYQKANSVTIAFNEASIKLHHALGFKDEGRIRRNAYTGGQYHDEVLFGMTREEFDEIESSYQNR